MVGQVEVHIMDGCKHFKTYIFSTRSGIIDRFDFFIPELT